VGENRKPRALRAWLFAENFGHVEQICDGVDGQDPRPPEGGIENFITSSERAGVRRRSPGSSFRPARLDYDHRFSQRYFARGREKRPGVADRLHVKENALSVRIIAKVVNQ